jgi:hypothetical protein
VSASLWVYAKRSGGGLVKLSQKSFESFYLREGALDLALADSDRYVQVAELLIQLRDGVPLRVLSTHFRRMRLLADGRLDPKHARLEMDRAMSRVDFVAEMSKQAGSEADEPGFPGLVQASSRFRDKRLDAICFWKPTPADLADLSAALEARINKRTSSREKHLRALVDRAVDERREIAGGFRTAAWKLEQLAQDPEPVVRAAVAANQNAPSEVLEHLRRDPADDVVSALASNMAADQSWLTGWAADSREAVRLAVASNRLTPAFAVERMAWSDRSEAVRRAAQARVDEDHESAVAAARSAYATEASLASAARDRRVEVRKAVAENPRASNDVLAILAGDVDETVREVVARRVGVEDARSLLRSGPGTDERPGRPPRQRSLPGLIHRRGGKS